MTEFRDTAREAAAQGDGDALDASTIGRRAASGAFLLTGRGVLQQLLGLGSTIIVTRLLAPHDLGVVALAMAIAGFVGMVAGGPGMTAALIRRETMPDREDLEALVGLLLSTTVVFAGIVALAMTPFGLVGRVTVVMLAALPLSAFRAPGLVAFERQLSYRQLTTVESVELFAYYGWSVGTVLAGWGVWGLATAVAIRTFVNAAMMVALSPHGLVLPRFDRARSRALVGIGARVQAVASIGALRDQVLLSGTAALAGLSVVGIWNLVVRFLLVPGLVFNSLLRVSFPAMSRLRSIGKDPARSLSVLLPAAAVLTGLLLLPLVSAAPALVPAVFGHRWAPTATAFPIAALAMVVVMPIAIAGNGYLWALGDAATPLRATTADAIVIVAVGLALVRPLGALGLALGFLASALAHSIVLARGIRRAGGIDVMRLVALPVLAWVLAAATGWGLAHLATSAPVAILSAVIASLLVYAALLAPMRAVVLHRTVVEASPILSWAVRRARGVALRDAAA